MTVQDLREHLLTLPDDMLVAIPTGNTNTGVFFSPCNAETGTVTTDVDTIFLLVPCGFYTEGDNKHELN